MSTQHSHRPPPAKLPQPLCNLGRHLEETFALWNVQQPTWRTRLLRSTIFTFSLAIIAFWPFHNVSTNLAILISSWLLLALTDRRVPSLLLMLHMQFNIALLFQLVNFSLRFWS